jgi:hypothetical protein
LKVAILSTPANIEIAQRYIDQSKSVLGLTHYFKRGRLCRKWKNGKEESNCNTLTRLTVLKDIRAESFDHFILVELPHGRSKVLPYYALLAVLSKARRKSVLLQDGECVPITAEILIRLARELLFFPVKFFAIFPLLLVNLVILLSIAIGVDMFESIRSRAGASSRRTTLNTPKV